jgi:hypothetical protein
MGQRPSKSLPHEDDRSQPILFTSGLPQGAYILPQSEC